MKLSTQVFFIAVISVVMIGSDIDTTAPVVFRLVSDAEAVIGRPLTPVSAGGVRRRTRRRTAAVTAAVVATPVVVAPAPVVVVPAPAVVPVPVPVPAPAPAPAPVPVAAPAPPAQ